MGHSVTICHMTKNLQLFVFIINTYNEFNYLNYFRFRQRCHILLSRLSIYIDIATGFRLMLFNATFKIMSVILWWSVLFEEETRVPGENHRAVESHWRTFSHNVVSSTSHHEQGSNSLQVAVNPTTIYSKSEKLYLYICTKNEKQNVSLSEQFLAWHKYFNKKWRG